MAVEAPSQRAQKDRTVISGFHSADLQACTSRTYLDLSIITKFWTVFWGAQRGYRECPPTLRYPYQVTPSSLSKIRSEVDSQYFMQWIDLFWPLICCNSEARLPASQVSLDGTSQRRDSLVSTVYWWGSSSRSTSQRGDICFCKPRL